MTKHVKAFTYGPKIPGIRNGTITQTIRAGDKVKRYDEILYHGWEGKPYYSGWDWRIRVRVIEVINIDMNSIGYVRSGKFTFWDSIAANDLAARDGIKKEKGIPLGVSLGLVIDKMHTLPKPSDNTMSKAQIIRHEWPPMEPEATD